MNVPDGVFSPTFSFKTLREEQLAKAAADGFDTLGERFTAVDLAAKSLGLGTHYKHYNKLLSKFAHPTAFSILERNSAASPKLKTKFYEIGVIWAKDSLSDIEQNLRGSWFSVK